MKGIFSAIALAVLATNAHAQVGHLPQNSPYRDLETRQELTAFGGYYRAGEDPIAIAPQDGPMWGLRYLIHVGGPAFLMARWSHVNSERVAIDPTKTGTARQLGKHNVSINLYDVDLALNLTGQKSFHHIVPVINLGAGIGSCGCSVTNDPYTFGTPFAFTFGGGLRWVPGGRFQLTADWNDYLYQLKYPTAYYLNPAGGTAAVPPNQARSFWKNNRALTIGASLLFLR
ncbi:MAG TPA: hypothetical protein VJ840_18085 [Gemmatimonadaceae bacterium]|nr:hypothetical protein [Gemmatimonadaceae bacterium]